MLAELEAAELFGAGAAVGEGLSSKHEAPGAAPARTEHRTDGRAPANPDRQAKLRTVQLHGMLPSMNSHFKGLTCSYRLTQPPEKVPWGDARV